jgi:hypothetical protein
MEFKIVEVVWMDAQSSMSSLTIDEAKKRFKPVMTRSVGYLIHEETDFILLAFTDFNEGQFKHWQSIPKGMIKKQKVLK